MKQLLCIWAITVAGWSGVSQAAPVPLASGGEARAAIVVTHPERPAEALAAAELTEHLQLISGAVIPIVADAEAAAYPYLIRIGGDTEQYANQEYHIYTADNELRLTGGGNNGALYAVYAFLQDDLGVRWFTVRDDRHIPRCEELTVAELDRRGRPAFETRHLTNTFFPHPADQVGRYLLRNKLNVHLNAWLPPGIKPDFPFQGPFVHSLFFYLPPDETPAQDYYGNWPSTRNLFATHPEFFSQAANGKRVKNMQLCFSNRAMRQLLTKHILEQLAHSDGQGVIDLSANDVPGHFCHCAPCLALEKQYGSIGGPLFDYLLEAAEAVAAVYPEAYLKTLAYRKEQSEIPPRVARFPDNVIIVFAPIDSDFSKTLDTPANQATLDHLKQWCQIAKHVWVWYYPNPYSYSMACLAPIGNVEKLAHDIKVIRDAGATGAFFEHDMLVGEGLNFAELQSWLQVRMFENPDLDPELLIGEFLSFQYGPAAPEIRQYLRELEQALATMPTPLSWNPALGMYPYLTPENLVKWQNGFDTVEAMPELAAAPEALAAVRRLRVALDAATLDRWPQIQKTRWRCSFGLDELIERLQREYANAVNHTSFGRKNLTAAQIQEGFAMPILLARDQVKALPPQLAALDPERVRQVFPFRNLIDDPEAATGRASHAAINEVPVTLGTYDTTGKRWLLNATLPLSDLRPGAYHLYPVGTTKITTECVFWLTQSWFATFPLEQLYVAGYPDQEWQVYASIRFTGPAYGGAAGEPDAVSCDRIILVRQ